MSKFKFACVLLAIGCSGAVDDKSTGDETPTLKQKLDVADARARGMAQGDACATHGWYGDGVCDTFCLREDTDCVPKAGAPIVCAQFIEGKDGVCGRPDDDPCRFQDPDCNAPTAGSGSGGGTVCAAFSEVPDGKCSRKADDPCRSQDPDCVGPSPGSGGSPGGGGVDCDTSTVTCETFAPVTCPDGKVPSVVNHCYGECVDKALCEPVACLLYIETSDGVCKRPYNDPCRGQDPDCSA